MHSGSANIYKIKMKKIEIILEDEPDLEELKSELDYYTNKILTSVKIIAPDMIDDCNKKIESLLERIRLIENPTFGDIAIGDLFIFNGINSVKTSQDNFMLCHEGFKGFLSSNRNLPPETPIEKILKVKDVEIL